MKYACCHCGGPVLDASANYPAQLRLGGPSYRGELRTDLLLCSSDCGRLRTAAAITMKTCAQCHDRFASKDGFGRPGRPALFCSAACRSTRDRALNRAMRALARGTVPRQRGHSSKDLKRWMDDLQEAIDEAVLLGEAWARGGSGASVEPDPRAVEALHRRVRELGELRNEASRAHARQVDAEYNDQGAIVAAQMIRPPRPDRSWADRLLARVGSGTVDDPAASEPQVY